MANPKTPAMIQASRKFTAAFENAGTRVDPLMELGTTCLDLGKQALGHADEPLALQFFSQANRCFNTAARQDGAAERVDVRYNLALSFFMKGQDKAAAKKIKPLVTATLEHKHRTLDNDATAERRILCALYLAATDNGDDLHKRVNGLSINGVGQDVGSLITSRRASTRRPDRTGGETSSGPLQTWGARHS